MTNTEECLCQHQITLDLTLDNKTPVLTLDNESIPDEPLSKKPICSRSIEKQMIQLRKKSYEKHFQYKGHSVKTLGKDQCISSSICINANDRNNNVRSDNNKNYPQLKQYLYKNMYL